MKMKNKLFKNRFLVTILLVIGCHISIVFTGIFHLPLFPILIIDGFLLLLFLASTFIISPGLDKAPDNFVNRFLLLTTLQLFTMMFSVLILSVIKIPHFKAIGYHLLTVFMCLLIMQAIFLVRLIKK